MASPSSRSHSAMGMNDRGNPLRAGGEMQAGPFEVFPDYSKLNAGRHNASRSDTFRTPSRLQKASARGAEASSSHVGTQEILDMCELSFAKNLRSLHQSLHQDLRAEIQEALSPLREELAGTIADARGATALEEIIRRLGTLEIPAVDLGPLRQEITRASEVHTDAVSKFEGQLGGEVSQLRRLLQAAQERQERHDQAEGQRAQRVADLESAMQRSQLHLEQVIQMQEALRLAAENIGSQVQQIQINTKKQQEILGPSLEEQLVKFVRTEPVNVDFRPPLMKIGAMHKSTSGELRILLQEIAKVQQALNVDFVNVLDTRLEKMGKVQSGLQHEFEHMNSRMSRSFSEAFDHQALVGKVTSRPRVREIHSQTVVAEVTDTWCQTDKFLLDNRGKAKAKTAARGGNRSTGRHRPLPSKAPQPVFADAEAMKQKAREALIRPQYNVFDAYHETGCFQAVAKSPVFETVTLCVIFINSIWIGVETDMNPSPFLYDAPLHFQVVENLFCTLFTLELIIRFLAFRRKRSCLRDFWFTFDSVLVLLMITETWIISIVVLASGPQGSSGLSGGSILRIVRVVKMLRISRMARLLREMPELLILIKGVKAASRSVSVFFALWLVIIYIYALTFRQIAESLSSETRLFDSVPKAMRHLLLDGILPSHASFINSVTSEFALYWPLILTFVALAVLTLMNMLVGVLVDVVGAIASTEKESMVVLTLASELRAALETHDIDLDNSFMQETEFRKMLLEPEFVRIIAGAGADVVLLADMSQAIFEDLAKDGKAGVQFEDLVDLVLNMRGTNPAKVKDVKEQHRLVKTLVRENTQGILKAISEEMKKIKNELREMKTLDAERHGETLSDDDDEQPSRTPSRTPSKTSERPHRHSISIVPAAVGTE